MFQRLALKALQQWADKEGRKPLVLRGARQVGKTTLVELFSRNFDVFINLNLEEKNNANLFTMNNSFEDMLAGIYAKAGFRMENKRTLIFIDEIQEVPRALTSLKYFAGEAPEYQIIAARSLLGIYLHPGVSFPVGKVDILALYPMSFYEFLLAMGEENGLAQIINQQRFDMMPIFHEKFKEYLKYYFFVGGMPEAVKVFAENRDGMKARQIQNKILKNYRNDFSKHAPKELIPRINLVWDSIPSQLSKENRKFIYGVLKTGGRAKEFELAIQWLTDAGVLHKVFAVSAASMDTLR